MSFLSSSNATAVGATNITVGRPAGATAAHRLVATVARAYLTGTMQAAAGWTQEGLILDSAAAFGELVIYTAAGDVATLNFSSTTNSGDWKVAVVALAGRSVGANVDAYANGTGTTIAVPSMTAVLNDDCVAAWIDFQNVASLGGPPAGFTDVWNDGTGTFHFIAAYDEALPAGATGALSRTCINFNEKVAGGILIPVSGGALATIMGTRIFVNG